MPTYFTVAQYIPDPIANERINIGIIVFGDGQIRSRFLRNWRRVAQFAQEDIAYVHEFTERIEDAAIASVSRAIQPPIPGLPSTQPLDENMLRRIIREWSNSIQFAPPEASLEEPEVLLTTLVETFLKEPAAKQAQFRDRQAAARLAVKVVRDAVAHRLGSTVAEQIVRAPYPIAGRVVPRLKVDLAVRNGRVYVATRALSFETHDMPELDEQIQRALYTLKDVGELHPKVHLDLVALSPNPALRGFREAQERFREVESSSKQAGVRLVLESNAEEWAQEIAELAESEVERPALTIAQF